MPRLCLCLSSFVDEDITDDQPLQNPAHVPRRSDVQREADHVPADGAAADATGAPGERAGTNARDDDDDFDDSTQSSCADEAAGPGESPAHYTPTGRGRTSHCPLAASSPHPVSRRLV